MNNRILFLLVAIIFSAHSYAGSMTGKVVKIELGPTYANNKVYVDIVGDSSTECASNNNGYDYHFDGGTETGKNVLSILLASQRSSAEVSISGTGGCPSSDTEELRWIQSK